MTGTGSKGIASIVVTCLGMLVALYVVTSVLSGNGNALGALYRYFLIGGFALGMLAPRMAFVGLIVMCGYIDVLKKLLVAGDHLSFLDLFFVLGIPPVTLLGICVNLGVGIVLGSVPTTTRNMSYLVVAAAVTSLLSVIAIAKVGMNPGVLKLLANSASYFSLIFVLPLLYQKSEDVIRLCRLVLYIMVPAAIHGLYHFKFGLFPFEEEYMMSGMSENLFYVLRGEGIFGPFSSQGALSATMTICAALSLMPFFIPRSGRSIRACWPRWQAVLLFVLFIAAALFSLKRGPMIILPAFIAAFVVFGRRWMTALSYVVLPLAALLLILNAGTLANKLPEWQDDINKVFDLGSAQKLASIRTLNARLEDFDLLTNSRHWQPFGLDEEELLAVGHIHAGLVRGILRAGWVPLIALAFVMIPVLLKFHSKLLMDRLTTEGFLSRMGAALGLAIFGSTALGFGSLTTFPIPFFIAFFLALFANFGFFKEPKKSEQSPKPDAPARRGAIGGFQRVSPG